MILHRDSGQMPKRKACWSSWVYKADGNIEAPSIGVTYWMNRLQNLDTKTDLFVTLNPMAEINDKAVDGTYAYQHPVFSYEAVQAQKDLWSLQGRNRTWFCGSYFGYGFHEDGLWSAVQLCSILLGEDPWGSN